MSDLKSALANAGKLKQWCQSVLDIVTEAEKIAPLEQHVSEIQHRLIQGQQQEGALKVRLGESQQAIEQARVQAIEIVAAAKVAAAQIQTTASTAADKLVAGAKDAVRVSYEAKAKLDAEVIAQQQELTTLKQHTTEQITKLADAKAAIERMLRP